MEKQEFVNRYYKDFGDGCQFISGLPLPRDPDGVVRNKRFVNCSFHPGCDEKVPGLFEDCDFIDCD